MDQPVKVASGFLHLLSHVIVTIEVEHVGNEVERILVVLDVVVQTCQVEPIVEILFINLAEVFVSARAYELLRDISQHPSTLSIVDRVQAAPWKHSGRE